MCWRCFSLWSARKATQIMLAVHTQGAAVVGIFPRDIAETKSEQVNQYAQENKHPARSHGGDDGLRRWN